MLTFFGEKKVKMKFVRSVDFWAIRREKTFKLNPELKSKGLYMNCMNDFVYSLPNLF